MRSRLIALLSMATLVSAQTPHAYLADRYQRRGSPGRPRPPAARTPLLFRQARRFRSRSSTPSRKNRPPRAIRRATVAFPIMAGMQVAIPAGSYVEGVVQQLTARASDTHQPQVGIHFTRLVFANGYSVIWTPTSAQAEMIAPSLGTPVTELAAFDAAGNRHRQRNHGDDGSNLPDSAHFVDAGTKPCSGYGRNAGRRRGARDLDLYPRRTIHSPRSTMCFSTRAGNSR